jgi:hypothetical protein
MSNSITFFTYGFYFVVAVSILRFWTQTSILFLSNTPPTPLLKKKTLTILRTIRHLNISHSYSFLRTHTNIQGFKSIMFTKRSFKSKSSGLMSNVSHRTVSTQPNIFQLKSSSHYTQKNNTLLSPKVNEN